MEPITVLFEVVLFILGVLAIVRRRIGITKAFYMEGDHARTMGIIMALPLPLDFLTWQVFGSEEALCIEALILLAWAGAVFSYAFRVARGRWPWARAGGSS
jgi:hypothetical protein